MWYSDTGLPVTWTSLLMRNGHYPNPVRFDDEQKVVGKAPESLPPNLTSNTLVSLGLGQNLVDRGFEFYEKGEAKSFGLRFILSGGFRNLRDRLLMEGYLPHEIAALARRKTS